MVYRGAGDYTWAIENNAEYFGVYGGGGAVSEMRGYGMYVLRVYLYIDSSSPGATSAISGTAQWAVYDDVYFWCEL
jgi:hypothetical protein